MKIYDVIIVGGGPSGCAAGYDLVNAGLSVLILDRKFFPRFKPCAGAVTVKTLKRLRYSIEPVVRKVISGKVVGLKNGKETLFQGNAPICVTTVREELDEFCLKQTLNNGAEFEVIPGIKDIYEDKKSVSLTDKNGNAYFCRFLIGADGVHSQIRKLTGDFKPDYTAFAVEGIVPLEKCDFNPEMTFDYGVVKNGYGWLIPKNDHINVGLYSSKPDSSDLTKAGLIEYVKKRIRTHEIDNITGFPIGTGGESYEPRYSRIFLTGDAAGFAEPLWGEGIHNAVKSGQAAAGAIISAINTGKDANQEYRLAIHDIKTDLYNCRKISKIFYSSLPISYTLLKTRSVRNAILKGFATGMTVTEICREYFRCRLGI